MSGGQGPRQNLTLGGIYHDLSRSLRSRYGAAWLRGFPPRAYHRPPSRRVHRLPLLHRWWWAEHRRAPHVGARVSRKKSQKNLQKPLTKRIACAIIKTLQGARPREWTEAHVSDVSPDNTLKMARETRCHCPQVRQKRGPPWSDQGRGKVWQSLKSPVEDEGVRTHESR